MRNNNSQIGPIRRKVLQLLTKFQELTIEGDSQLYNFFTNLHFRAYTGISLDKACMSNSVVEVDMFAAAARRHSNMVISLIYKNSSKTHKQVLKKLAIESFTKNYLLEQKL